MSEPSPGETSSQPAAVTSSTPAASPAAPSPQIADVIAQYEARINGLMSSYNKQQAETVQERVAREQAEKLAREAAQRAQEQEAALTKLREEQQAMLDAVTKAQQDILNAAKAKEEEAKGLRAELAKAQVLAQHPELAGLAALIPATEDADQLANAIKVATDFVSAREQAFRQQQQAGFVPASNPSRPASGGSEAEAEQLYKRVRELGRSGNPVEFQKALDELNNLNNLEVSKLKRGA